MTKVKSSILAYTMVHIIYTMTMTSLHVIVQQNCSLCDQKCPIKVLYTSDTTELHHWLCVKEARCDDGQPYTPRSLTQLHSGLKQFKNRYHS